MAQLVERVLGKDEVGGSNPPSSSKNTSTRFGWMYFFSEGIGGFEGGSRFVIAKRFAQKSLTMKRRVANDDVDNVVAGRRL